MAKKMKAAFEEAPVPMTSSACEAAFGGDRSGEAWDPDVGARVWYLGMGPTIIGTVEERTRTGAMVKWPRGSSKWYGLDEIRPEIESKDRPSEAIPFGISADCIRVNAVVETDDGHVGRIVSARAGNPNIAIVRACEPVSTGYKVSRVRYADGIEVRCPHMAPCSADAPKCTHPFHEKMSFRLANDDGRYVEWCGRCGSFRRSIEGTWLAPAHDHGRERAKDRVDPKTWAVDYEGLDPGIRETVRWLVANGFATTDSGDGVSKNPAIYEDVLEYPHVFMLVDPADMVSEAQRLRSLVGDMGWIEATYSPDDKTGILSWTHVNDQRTAILRIASGAADSSRADNEGTKSQ